MLPPQDFLHLCLRMESAPAAKDLGRRGGATADLGAALGEPYLRLAPRALWVAGWRLPAAKITSKSGCLCRNHPLPWGQRHRSGVGTAEAGGRGQVGAAALRLPRDPPALPTARFFPGNPFLFQIEPS